MYENDVIISKLSHMKIKILSNIIKEKTREMTPKIYVLAKSTD